MSQMVCRSYSSRHHFSHIVYIIICQETLYGQAYGPEPGAFRSVYVLTEHMCCKSEDLCRFGAL